MSSAANGSAVDKSERYPPPPVVSLSGLNWFVLLGLRVVLAFKSLILKGKIGKRRKTKGLWVLLGPTVCTLVVRGVQLERKPLSIVGRWVSIAGQFS